MRRKSYIRLILVNNRNEYFVSESEGKRIRQCAGDKAVIAECKQARESCFYITQVLLLF